MVSASSSDGDPRNHLLAMFDEARLLLESNDLTAEQRALITAELGSIAALANGVEVSEGPPAEEHSATTDALKSLALEREATDVAVVIEERRIGGWREITPERRLARRAHMVQGFDTFMGVLLDDDQEIPGFTPAPHQPELFGRVGSFVHLDPDPDGTLAGYIKGPPNVGKTVIQAISARAFQIGEVVHPDEPPLSALALVPSRKIGRQTGADEGRGFGKFAGDLDLGRYFGGEKVIGDVTVMTYKSFAALSPEKRDELSNRVDLVFGDEIHRAYGERTAEAFKSFIRGKLVVALTATPAYREGRTIETELGINHKITDISFRKGIEDGICNGAQVLALDGGGRVNVRFDRGIGEGDVKHLMFDEDRNTLIVDFMRTMAEEGRTGIVRCVPGGGTLDGGITASSLHARMIAASASRQEIIDPQTGLKRTLRVEAVGNFQSDEENDRILEDYSNGLVDALTFTKYLIEGYDEDRVEYVFDTSPTTSEVDKDQLAGRGMRLKDILTLYIDLVDTYVGAGKKVRLFLDTFEEREFKQGQTIGKPGRRSGRFGREGFRRRSGTSRPSSGQGRTRPGKFFDTAAFSLLSLPPNIRRAADALAGRTLAELTVIARKHDKVPDGWLPVDGLTSLGDLTMPTRMRILEGREDIEMRQSGPNGQWYVPPHAETLLADVDTSVADSSLVRAGDTGVSSELFMKLTNDKELGLKRIWTRTNSATKKPGWHLSAEDNRRLQAYLRAEYVPIDPTVEISIPNLARQLGRHRTEVRTRIGRLTSQGATINTYSKWTDRRKEATCMSHADAEIVARSLGAKMPEDGVSIATVAAELDVDIEAARSLIEDSPFSADKRGGPLRDGGYIDWFDPEDAPKFYEWAAQAAEQTGEEPQVLQDGDTVLFREPGEPVARPLQRSARKPVAVERGGRKNVYEFDESAQDADDLAKSAGITVRRVRVLIEKLQRDGKFKNKTPAIPRKRVGGRISPHYRGDMLDIIQTALIDELEN